MTRTFTRARRRSTVLVLAASAMLASLGAIATPAHALSSDWIVPVNLSSDNVSVQPTVAASGAGTFAAVWRSFATGSGQVQVARSTDGVNWSAPVTLGGTDFSAQPPSIAGRADGSYLAVWEGASGGTRVIRSAFSSDGLSWSAPVELTPTSVSAVTPSVAVNASGRFTVTWRQGSPSATTTVHAASTVNGQSWSATAQLGSSPPTVFTPRIAAGTDGRFVVVWANSNGGSGSVLAATSSDGISWTPASAPIAQAPNLVPFPIVASNGTGGFVAAWTQPVSGGDILFVSTSPDGSNWGAPVAVTPSTERSLLPRIVADRTGRLVLTWQRNTNNSAFVVFASTSLGGTSWSTPVALSGTSAVPAPPDVAVDSTGKFYAVWAMGTVPTTEVAISTDGQNWSSPRALSSGVQEVGGPLVVTDPLNRVVVSWSLNTGPGTAQAQATTLRTTVTVNFAANGGSGTVASLNHVIGDQALSVPSGSGLSRAGFSFLGWNTAANGSGTAFAPGASLRPSGDLTLYAQWRQVTPPTTTTTALAATGLASEPLLWGAALLLLGGLGVVAGGRRARANRAG